MSDRNRKRDISNRAADIMTGASNFDFDSDLGPDLSPESGPEAAGDPGFDSIQDFPLRVPSLTNSPGCAPGLRQPRTTRHAQTRVATPLRRVRPVHVDAWATPASTSWTRTRRTVRKVSRQSQSTSWALPF
jgi:hypothetical protein